MRTEVTHSFGSRSFHHLHFVDVYEFVTSVMKMFRFPVPGSEASFMMLKEKQNLSLETVDSQRYLRSLSKENVPFASPIPGGS